MSEKKKLLSRRKEILSNTAEDLFKYLPSKDLKTIKEEIEIDILLKEAKEEGPVFPDSLLGAKAKGKKKKSKKKKSKKMKRKKNLKTKKI